MTVPGGSRLLHGNGRQHGPTERSVELPDGFAFELTYALGAQPELDSDLLKRARSAVKAEVRHDHGALPVGQAAQGGRQRQLPLMVERRALRIRGCNVGERPGERQSVDPKRLVERNRRGHRKQRLHAGRVQPGCRDEIGHTRSSPVSGREARPGS